MAGPKNRRISKFPSDHRPPPPSPALPFDPIRPFDLAAGRDSDASLCSSRPSSAGAARHSSALITDRSAQSSALRAVNTFLSSHSAPLSLKPPLPSARDIAETFRFVLSRLDWDLGDLDDKLVLLLRQLRCPIKLNRSALKAPGTPHAWPPLLSVLYWLVQLALVADHIAATPLVESSNDLLHYVTRSYSLYISGDDVGVEELDEEYVSKAQHQADSAAGVVEGLKKEVEELDAKLLAMKAEPSKKDALEQLKRDLMEDVKKFQAVVDSYGRQVAAVEGMLGEREKELEAKEKENKRLCEENEELLKKIDSQAVNVRDAERMKRELQAVETEILEVESARNKLEENAWKLETTLGRKLNEIEVITEECNKAIRR